MCLDGVRFLLCDGMPLKTSSAVKRKEAKESNDVTWTKSSPLKVDFCVEPPSGCVFSSSFFYVVLLVEVKPEVSSLMQKFGGAGRSGRSASKRNARVCL